MINKEALHIFRDKRTMTITLLMPMVLLLLFGFAISTEVNDVRVAVVTGYHGDVTHAAIERLRVNRYVTFMGIATADEVDRMLRRGEIDVALFLKEEAGTLSSQIVADASNTIVSRASTGYISGIVSGYRGDDASLTCMLYNPRMKSAYNFVPGIMGMIFILICAIMTSVSIVREKENGTMNLLLVSPVKPRTIIFGKLVPYFVLSCLILLVMLTIAYTVLGLPVSSGVANVVAVSLIYIALSLSIGLLVSALVDTQLTALIVSAVLFMLPVIMLSGMIFPVDNMPVVLRWISCIIPARWYTEAMRKLMIQQLGLGYVAKEIVILVAMTALLLFVAIKRFNVKR